MGCHLAKIFIHLLIIARVSNFNFFKLIEWYQQVNNRNTRKRCEDSEDRKKLVEHRSGVFVINFEHIPYIFLVFLLFTMNR